MIPKRFWLVFGTFLLSMLLYVDRACISTAKDAIRGDLGFSDAQWGWIMAAFGLGYALCQTPAGLAADRLGPRRLLTSVVAFWSLFTALTGAAWSFTSMLAFRVLFGAGEAGAFPGCARAYYSWLPTSERGLAQGINFSGSRLGAAVAMPLVAWLIGWLGWRTTFAMLGVIGFFWAFLWFLWFRDEPTDHPKISAAERDLILAGRQQTQDGGKVLTASALFGSRNMWLAMGQYICSNFTFYFAISWSFPYVKKTFGLTSVEAGLYSAIPLLGGALGNWIAGALVDGIYRSGRWKSLTAASRHAWLLPRCRRTHWNTIRGYSHRLLGIPRGSDLGSGHDAESVLGLLYRYRAKQRRCRFGHDEHGRKSGRRRDHAGLPLFAGMDGLNHTLLPDRRIFECRCHRTLDNDAA
jgi:ACS family glucarate transporter-like MFS transporter